jgi:pimeloyl-ACP methyl ester carboxylesterase
MSGGLPPGHAACNSVVLLHGKNFCAATWEGTIRVLSEAGYRVLALDQRGYQFSFAQLAANTHALLVQAGVERPIVMGHSMGGMLAARYALQYPDEVAQLVMVDRRRWKHRSASMPPCCRRCRGAIEAAAGAHRLRCRRGGTCAARALDAGRPGR